MTGALLITRDRKNNITCTMDDAQGRHTAQRQLQFLQIKLKKKNDPLEAVKMFKGRKNEFGYCHGHSISISSVGSKDKPTCETSQVVLSGPVCQVVFLLVIQVFFFRTPPKK